MPQRTVIVLKIGGRALEPAGDAADAGASANAPGAATTRGAPATPRAAAATGAAPARNSAIAQLGAELVGLGVPVVIVHGGGAEVSAWCERLGVAPRFVDGLRVTDPATLEIATAVLAGLANKRLVARLRAAGLDAVGLSALDGGTIEAVPHPRAEALGAVGAVFDVQPALLETLLDQGRIPVIASICDCEGALLNVNADDLAAALAGALKARALVLLSDAPGLILDGAVVPRLAADALADATDRPEVQGGMRPKLIAARAALEAGVPRVHIAAWSGPGTLDALLGAGGDGTTISAAPDVVTTPHAGVSGGAGHPARTSTPTAGVRND
jgi:acetylglutamate kinase